MRHQLPMARETKKAAVQIDTLEKDGSFSGYASLFGKVDLGKDRVERGAFNRSLNKRGAAGIRMLYQHDPAEPIGTWLEIKEDQRGLFVRGKITTASSKGAEVLGLLRDGALDGLSIGFKTIRSRHDRQTGVRKILEADLWEISVVTFPMLPQARVASVKNIQPNSSHELPSVRVFERWLTHDAGLSRSEARTVIGKGFAHLARKRDAATPGDVRLAGQLRAAARTISP